MDMANRKITKIGNSYGLTIPVEMLKEAGIKYGDNVQLKLIDNNIQIVKERNVSLPDGISEDFFDVIEETMETYDQTIKGLVDR